MQYFAAGKKAPELKGDAAQHSATVLAAAVVTVYVWFMSTGIWQRNPDIHILRRFRLFIGQCISM